jgi:hypothetical protein
VDSSDIRLKYYDTVTQYRESSSVPRNTYNRLRLQLLGQVNQDCAPLFRAESIQLVSSLWRPAFGPWLVATTVTGACKVKFSTVSDGSLIC